jgi:hypothetical protein
MRFVLWVWILFLCVTISAVAVTPNTFLTAEGDSNQFSPCDYPQYLNLTVDSELAGLRKDSTNTKTPKDSIPWPNPDIAWKLSLIPGGGQFYNKSYWKPPIIYAGLGVFSYLILDNHSKYKQFRQSYLAKTGRDRIDLHGEFSVEAVQAQRNFHRQTRDMLFLVGTFWYALNIVEAYVYAHLKHFDVSEKISWYVVPGPVYTPYTKTQINPGIQAVIHF